MKTKNSLEKFVDYVKMTTTDYIGNIDQELTDGLVGKMEEVVRATNWLVTIATGLVQHVKDLDQRIKRLEEKVFPEEGR